MTATAFEKRMAAAAAFEKQVRDALAERGWYAEPFGQAQLTERTRQALRDIQPTTRVRWLPDIIASRRFSSRTQVIYIDAKAGDKWRETGRHDFECAAVEASAKWAEYSGCPTYFVCSDWSVYTPDHVAETGTPGSFRGSGSGTPFLLVLQRSGLPFDVFGAVAA